MSILESLDLPKTELQYNSIMLPAHV